MAGNKTQSALAKKAQLANNRAQRAAIEEGAEKIRQKRDMHPPKSAKWLALDAEYKAEQAKAAAYRLRA